MTQLSFGRDIQGLNAYAPQMSDVLYSAELATGSEDSIQVPATAKKWIAVISAQPGSIIWVAVNDTATPPAGASFSGTTSFLLPAQISVNAGDVISCYNNSTTDQDVGIALYAVS